MRLLAARVVAVLVTIATLLLGGALPASAVTVHAAAAAATEPAIGTTWFGPDLDWGDDSPAGYEGRLGATPSMYGVEVDYPLDRSAR
ncbi:hypothetical protein EDF31_10232 [Curtobacterium sp. PhB142]|uniref:hypothetical protein n=1 Tax=unclassified Curtobacterium TaxID=257496 RepID=UPI00104FDB2C|nr:MULTISPECIES: hypothetical protein [unclassified Curtobacterium]TCL87334.1 hypothetical protein EDF31_10232 [Curtobacterium sp. PhB142]TCM05317.1 hypothetical protein EDF26_101547 [Curtobacterium sp. PhB134]